jgi:dolichyl-phosphate-mannose--protein O-mannosyl transferase
MRRIPRKLLLAVILGVVMTATASAHEGGTDTITMKHENGWYYCLPVAMGAYEHFWYSHVTYRVHWTDGSMTDREWVEDHDHVKWAVGC